jgi:hypothetical protein
VLSAPVSRSVPGSASRLADIRFDSDRVHGAIATIAHAEVLVAKEAVTADGIAFWQSELDAVGPNFEQRRMAAVIALAAAGEISHFVAKKDHKGEPDKIHLAMASPERSPFYLNKLLPMWGKFTAAFGTEAQLVERLGMSGETVLPLFDPNLSNAEHLFEALYHPPVMHLQQDAEIQLLARFRPRSKELRVRDLVRDAQQAVAREEAAKLMRLSPKARFQLWATTVARAAMLELREPEQEAGQLPSLDEFGG